MDKILDKAFDYIGYATAIICFTSASVYILIATVKTLQGWNGMISYLWNAGLLIGLGIIVSAFVYYIKSIAVQNR